MMNEIATLDRPSSELVAEWPGYVVAFQNALTAAQDGLATAAGIYVAAIDEDPERAKEFRAALPTFSETVWSSFEKIGRKQVDPRVLFGDGGPHRARIKQLPYTTQKRLLDGEPVELLVSEGDVLKVDAVCDLRPGGPTLRRRPCTFHGRTEDMGLGPREEGPADQG